MEEQDYTNPIVEESTKEDIKGTYGDTSVAESVDAKLARQRKRKDAQLEQIRARQSEEDARREQLKANPDPFSDEADYFGLITSGKIDDSLESLDYLGVDVSLKGRDYYWNNDKVKEKFIEQYGEGSAEDMFNIIYEEVDKQYYNHIAKHSMLSTSGINTAIFVEEMGQLGKTEDMSGSMGLSGMIGRTPDNAVSVTEEYENRGAEALGDFYVSDRSAREMNLDYYRDPDTGEIKELTPDRIEELEGRDDFVAFKYNQKYLGTGDRDRARRFVTVHKKGDELLASDQLVSAWDVGGGWLSNNGRENDWYKTVLMAVPKFGAELSVGSVEAVNNIAMVGSALLAGDNFSGSTWEKWLSDNEGWLRSHKFSSTDEALENPYTSLDGLTDLVVNVTSQFAAAYLTGGATSWVARGAMGYGKALGNVTKLGKAQDFIGQAAAGKVARNIAMRAGKAGNIAGKSLMTSMAMGDIYQVGREMGLTPREAASVASLAYAGLWQILNLSDYIWKPFDANQVRRELSKIANTHLKNEAKTLTSISEAALKEMSKKTMTNAEKASFIKALKDKSLIKSARNITNSIADKFKNLPSKTTAIGRDAFNESLEEVSEFAYQEALKNSYNMVSELWHEPGRSHGKGKFFGSEDEGYFTQKMDEAIQSFVGGFLGGGFMGVARVSFRTPQETKSLVDLMSTGKVDQYVKLINDAFNNKQESRIFAPHEYTMTTKRREDENTSPDGGQFLTTAEAPNEKSIAEIKRDLLLEEINHLQTTMEIDGVAPSNLQKAIDDKKSIVSAPNLTAEYSKELEKYLSAVDERSRIKTGEMASTDDAIATSDAAMAQKSADTREAIEKVPDKLANIETEIQTYVKNMHDITNGLTILNHIKKEKLKDYNNLNSNNKLTGNDSLFDDLNVAQANEKVKEDSKRKQRVERADNLHTAIEGSLDNLDKVEELITGTEKEQTEEGTIDHGAKFLWEKDKENLQKKLEERLLTMPQVMASGNFEEKFKEKATEIINNSYNIPEISDIFGTADSEVARDNVNLFLDALTNKHVDRLTNTVKSSKKGDVTFKKLSNNDPLLLIGQNAALDKIELLDPNLINTVVNASNKGEIDAYVDSLYKLLYGEMQFSESMERVDNQFEELFELYKESSDNFQISSLIKTLQSIENVDDQEGDIHISEITDKHVIIDGNDFTIFQDVTSESLVNKEARTYHETALSDGSDVHTYKDSTDAENAINHFNAQIESILLTSEFANSEILMDARLRSMNIRKGIIKASSVNLITPYEIKDSYDNFEDFFSTMYFDPLRKKELLNKKDNGTITSIEQEELEDINNYLTAAGVVYTIETNLSKPEYVKDYNLKIIKFLADNFLNVDPALSSISISKVDLATLIQKASLVSDKVSDTSIPFGNEEFSNALRKILPAPIGQYINLLRAKNDMKFFVEHAENNKNIGEIGMTLRRQDKIYTDSLDVYNDVLIKDLLANTSYNFDEEFKSKLIQIVGEMETILGSKEEVNKDSVAAKFNTDRKFLKLLYTIKNKEDKLLIIRNLREAIGTGITKRRFKDLKVEESLGIIGEVTLALEYNVDNFYAPYKELISTDDTISKLQSGTPDALQEKAALMIAGFIESEASDNTDLKNIAYIEGALATGKSTYALGVGLKVHQMNVGSSEVIFAANNQLQIDNLKKTGADFNLKTYESEENYDLVSLVAKVESEDPSLDNVDVIVYDEATMIDGKTYLSTVTDDIDNLYRLERAIIKINAKRDKNLPKLRLLLVGDSNQNGFESGMVRLGAKGEYVNDEKNKHANKDLSAFQYNIGNYGYFGTAGTQIDKSTSVLRSRRLESQYRSVSAEIPQTVEDIQDLVLKNNTNLVEDFKLTTKYGYSESEGKFLGVNVKPKFEDFSKDEEYLAYLEKRIQSSTPKNPFTVGIASDRFNLKSTEANLQALTTSPKLLELVKANPDVFVLAKHEQIQGSSVSLMVVDMDKKSFRATDKLLEKINDRRKLYTSVGRGIEHVIIINDDKYTNIKVGDRDNSVRTHGEDIIADVVKETRAFTIERLTDLTPTEILKSPEIKPTKAPEPASKDGWTTVDAKTEQKFLGEDLLIRTTEEDGTIKLEHLLNLGTAVNKEGHILTVNIKFPITAESDLVLIDGMNVPLPDGNYSETGIISFMNTEIDEPVDSHKLDDYLNFENINDNLDEIITGFGYTTEKDALNTVLDGYGNSVIDGFDRGYKKGKHKPVTYKFESDSPFGSVVEATENYEKISGATLVKNNIFKNDKGAISVNKLLHDNLFGRKAYESSNVSQILAEPNKQKRNYLLEQEYDQAVRDRLSNVTNYDYKIMIVTSDERLKAKKTPTVHIISYDKQGNNPLVIGNLIDTNSTDSNYEIVEILKTPIANFIKDLANDNVEVTSSIINDTKKFRYKEFDYVGRVVPSHIAPGTPINLNKINEDGSNNEDLAQAKQIVMYDPAFDGIRSQLLNDNGNIIKSEYPVQTLIASLEAKGIYVSKELLIQLNTANKHVGGVNLLLNQVVADHNNVMKTEDVISSESMMSFNKHGDGRVGKKNGWFSIALNNKGWTLTDAFNMLKDNENVDFAHMLTRNKSVEMIELFSTVGNLIGDSLGIDANKHESYANLKKINENIKTYYPKKGGRVTTNIFTKDNTDIVKESIEAQIAKDQGSKVMLELFNVIVDMFHVKNLGTFARVNGVVNPTNESTDGRQYLSDISHRDAPIKYIIPSEEGLSDDDYMPTINFSLNNLFRFFDNATNDGNSVVFSTEKLVSAFDNILKSSKFTNGIYINLDKIDTIDSTTWTYDAIAADNKLPNKDNLDFYETNTVGVSNPNLSLSLKNIENSLAEKVSEEDKTPDSTLKIDTKQLKDAFNVSYKKAIEDSMVESKDLYTNYNETDKGKYRDAVVDAIYETHFKKLVDAYISSMADLKGLNTSKSLLDLEKKVRDGIISRAAQIKNPEFDPDQNIIQISDLNINSLEDVVAQWDKLDQYKNEYAENKFPSEFVILGEGSDIIQDTLALNSIATRAKSNIESLFPYNMAVQFFPLIDSKVNSLKKDLQGLNQLTIDQRLEKAPSLQYLNKVGVPSEGMSVQNLMLNIKTIDYELDQAKKEKLPEDTTLSDLIAERDQKIEQLTSLIDTAVISSRGVITVGNKTVTTIKLTDEERKSIQFIDRQVDGEFIETSEGNKQKKKLTEPIINRAIEDIIGEHNEKVLDLSAFFSKDNKVKSRIDEYGFTYYINRETSSHKKYKKTTNVVLAKYALENATSAESMALPLTVPDEIEFGGFGVSENTEQHDAKIIEHGVNPYELAEVYLRISGMPLDIDSWAKAIKDAGGFRMSVDQWKTISGQKENDIDPRIMRTYLFKGKDPLAVEREEHDVDGEILAEGTNLENIDPDLLVRYAELYPTQSDMEFDQFRTQKLRSLAEKFSKFWGININESIANKIIAATPDSVLDITEVSEKSSEEIAKLTIKKKDFAKALKDKIPSPSKFKSLIEDNWMYEGLSIQAVEQKYNELIKSEKDPVKIDQYTNQLKGRRKLFGDEKSFESKLALEMQKEDFDVYEFAKNKKDSAQANYIRSIIQHIESFLLYNKQDAVTNRLALKDTLEKLIEDPSNIAQAAVDNYIKSINVKIDYIKKLPTFNSARVNESITTNIAALKTLISDLNGLFEESYEIPMTNNLDISNEEFESLRQTLNDIMKDDDKKVDAFKSAMAYRQDTYDSSELDGYIDEILDGITDENILDDMEEFITNLNNSNFKCND
jgi:hypothetical protein